MTQILASPTPLAGKIAVITGASRGIGRAIALAYARAGADIACAARTASDLHPIVDEIASLGRRAIGVPTDVRDLSAVEDLMARAAGELGAANGEPGAFDILVINAGGIWDRGHTVEESDPDGWRQTLEVNLFGAYYCARAAIPYMRRRGAGKIITIGSGVGHRGSKGTSAYAASKAGLWMLTRVLAQELAPYRISVNELIPGPVATDLNTSAASQLDNADAEGEWFKRPVDVGPVAVFLAAQPDHGPTAQSFSILRRDN